MRFPQIAVILIAGLLAAAFDTPEAGLKEGDAHHEKQDYKSAIETYTKVIESGSAEKATLGKAYLGRSRARLSLIDATGPDDAALMEALQDSTKAIELLPGDAPLYRHRGTIYAYLGAYPEAFADFQSIRFFEGARPMWSLVRKGGLQRRLGDHEGALKSFRSVIRSWGEPLMPPNYHMALTYMELQKYGPAVAALDEGMKAQDNYAWAYMRRGCAKANLGQYAEALKDYQHGEELYRNYPRFDPPYPAVRHNSRIVAEELKLLQGIVQKKIVPDPARLRKLCMQSWWDIHFDKKRERSPLLAQ